MPYERNPYFTGRDAELTALCDALTAHKNAALTQALSGMGGIGKTQTAIEYAYRCKGQEEGYPTYEYILFTRADSTNALLTGYGEIAKALALPLSKPDDQQQVADEVRQWLEANDNWLLLYDNADDPELLRPFRPRNAKGHILLTSRAHRFKADLGVGKPIELKSLLPEDAIRFLFQRTLRDADTEPADECNAVAELAQELGYFPLALEQAAAYIVAEDKRFAAYLAEYSKREQELLNKAEPELGDYRDEDKQEYKTVRTTWDLNFAAIESANPASAELLKFSAFLAPDDIPAELIILGASELGPLLADVFTHLENSTEVETAYDNLLTPLLNYSLIEKDRDAYTYSIHRMVQSVLRDRLKEQKRHWIEDAVRALNAAFPGVEFTDWPQCARFLPHTLACLQHARQENVEMEERARLCNQAGYYLSDRGLYAEAEPLYLEALEICRKSLPEGHPDIALSLNNLAGLYNSQGLYEKAEPLYLQALEMRRNSMPEGHPSIATSLNNLAALYKSQGLYEKAEPLHLQALEIWRNSLPEGHPHIAQSLNNLAELYRTQGLFEKAEPLYLQALEIMHNSLPEDHPHIAQSLNNLALLYYSQGLFEKAEPLYLQALEIYRNSLPDGHPSIAQSLNNLAALYNNQELFEKAEPHLLAALTIFVKALGPQHPDTQTVLMNYLVLLVHMGRDAEVEAIAPGATAQIRALLA